MSTYQAFIERDIKLHNLTTITLDVDPDQVAPGTEIFPGSRITGKSTSIGPHCRIGSEGPATIEDCQLGPSVTFASGFAKQATMLDAVTIGANAHIRPGTLLEEQACLAHCVALKQTLLLPFVTLGSLINFCDCLMAGGTSRSHHSEVGSSFVHFNFTPRQDKATPSLFGDIPNGVLLDQPPIFLGGQCGVVGPVRVAYGAVLAAGSILRKDILTPNALITPEARKPHPRGEFQVNAYGNIDRIVHNNCIYIGNLHALYAWYQVVRSQFMMSADPFQKACLQGASQRLEEMVAERTKQLSRMAERLQQSPRQHPSHAKCQQFLKQHDLAIPQKIPEPPESFIQHIREQEKSDYLACMQSMPPDSKQQAREWLQSFIENITFKWEHCTNE